jgi:hypothetical protein
MATAKVSPLSLSTQSTITAEQIAHYPEVSTILNELEDKQKALRSELLTLRAAGAEQETTAPYLLNFVDQERRTVDWKAQAFTLAEKLYGLERAATWKAKVEHSAPVQSITQVRVKPNPSYAAGLEKPAVSVSEAVLATPLVQ